MKRVLNLSPKLHYKDRNIQKQLSVALVLGKGILDSALYLNQLKKNDAVEHPPFYTGNELK